MQIVKNLAALRDELEQSPSRMVVLDVGLEMFGQVGDPFRQNGDLNLRRTGIAIRRRVRLDDFRLQRGDEHR